ncbi:nucleotide-binding protein [Exiguobacterium sp. s193]|uniref:nucleotide-binding protein n=1 Tax=Exiguobacterium sp. s193 TaxID=2751207 RepID=UPI00333BF99A
MSYEKKKEILDDLMTKASKMKYETRQSDLQIFTQELHTVLPYVFENHKEKIANFSRIKFRPAIFSTGDNTRLFTKVFMDGKQSTIDFISGLIHAIEFEHSIGIKEASKTQLTQEKPIENKKIFIVHGHDENLKSEVALFVERQGLESVILHQQASGGKTIIEKLEERSDVGFAIVLYTPCDVGRVSTARRNNPRARQNVVFEHGFFIGKIGRGKVVALVKDGTEIPNDYSGVVYVNHNENGAWKTEIGRELAHAGYAIDFMKF